LGLALSALFERQLSMRPQIIYSFLLAATVASMLGACASGGSVAPTNGGQTRSTSSRGNLVISGSINGTGPQLLAHVRRLAMRSGRRMAFTFKSYSVQGTLFPADANDNIVTNSGVGSVSTSGVFSASVSFSNVPVHDNEWAILQFIGVASDGSQIALGELAGLVNVTASPTNSSTLTEATTQTFQVFTTLANNGEISTYDLDNTATLASTLASDISATGITPDPTTLLYDQNELTTLYNDIAPKFQRNATITASPAVNGSFFLLRNYTNAEELYLTSNLSNFFSIFALLVQPPVIGGVFGGSIASCGGFVAAVPLHEPETNPTPVPSLVSSCVIPESGSTTIHNVYGGHLLIGATNDKFNVEVPIATPFDGGFTSFAGAAPGTFATTVTTASTQESVKVTDPAGFAFGAEFFSTQGLGTFWTQPGFGNAPLSAATFTAVVEAPTFRILIPTPYSSSSNTLTVDKLDPWDISEADTQLCGGVSCFALTATQPFVIKRPFADAGTDIGYFAWKASGTASAISQVTPNPPGGYKVTISGAGTATLTTTTASVLEPRQIVFIEAPTVVSGTWTITAKDSSGNTYTDSAPAEPGLIEITMDSVGNTVTTTSIAISFTTTAAGSVTIDEITQL
jgi:hypothetical protein